jgi:hypothetical protein
MEHQFENSLQVQFNFQLKFEKLKILNLCKKLEILIIIHFLFNFQIKAHNFLQDLF